MLALMETVVGLWAAGGHIECRRHRAPPASGAATPGPNRPLAPLPGVMLTLPQAGGGMRGEVRQGGTAR